MRTGAREKGAFVGEQSHWLGEPDVKVTNQSDKEIQLPKLKALDEFAKRAVEGVSARGGVGS